MSRWHLDLAQLEIDLKTSAVEMAWLQDFLGDEWVGDGFNAPKVHDLLNFARQISEIGSALNCSTGAFERTNIELKAADRATGRSTVDGDHGTARSCAQGTSSIKGLLQTTTSKERKSHRRQKRAACRKVPAS